MKVREKAKRDIKKSRNPADYIEYKGTKAIATKIIKAAKRKSWRTFCSLMSDNIKFSSVWNEINHINVTNKNDNIPALKKGMGETYTDNAKEKANVMAEHFAKVRSMNNYSETFQNHKQKFEKDNSETFKRKNNDDSMFFFNNT